LTKGDKEVVDDIVADDDDDDDEDDEDDEDEDIVVAVVDVVVISGGETDDERAAEEGFSCRLDDASNNKRGGCVGNEVGDIHCARPLRDLSCVVVCGL
jgi:hypothetical protein